MCPRGQDQNIDFVVQNLNANTGFELANQDCYDKWNSEVGECTHGGEETTHLGGFSGKLLLWEW